MNQCILPLAQTMDEKAEKSEVHRESFGPLNKFYTGPVFF